MINGKSFADSYYFYISISFSNDEKRGLLIFAPASLRDALEELVKNYELNTENIEITNVFLGTSQLAKQIYHGAKPDIFISANKEWMDYLEDKSLIVKNLRFNYLTNSLVIITNQRNFIKKNKSYLDIKNTLINTESRLSLALVNAVPAGIYAKQTLKKLKIWKAVRDNLAQSSNVRTAMQFVSRGDLEYGIVYKSDVIASKSNIEIIFEVEKKLHDEMINCSYF